MGFLHTVRQVDPCAHTIVPRHEFRGGFALRFSIKATGVPIRDVEVHFSPGSPSIPRVFVDGSTDSPHRYPDKSLCMWYPYDPPDARWWPTDGAAELLAHIAAHLIREQWWRRTGEWPGEEVPHMPNQKSERAKQ